MKHILCTIALLASSFATYAQRTEFSVQAGSGLFSFRGPGAVSETYIVGINFGNFSPYVVNPYGRSTTLSYGLTGQVQRVTRSTLVYGVQTGYESLASEVAITSVLEDYGHVLASGRTRLRNEYVNVSPFVGKRFGNERISVDVTAGTDLGIGLSNHEHSEVRGNQSVWTPADVNRALPAIDVRPRLSVTGYYRALGLSLGYSHGLTNYASGQLRDQANVYSRFWRAGVTYRFGKRAG